MRLWALAIALGLCSCSLESGGFADDIALEGDVGSDTTSTDATAQTDATLDTALLVDTSPAPDVSSVDTSEADGSLLDAVSDTMGDASDGADVRDASDASADTAPCVPVVTTKLCTEIEHLESLATAQLLDGAADDFCGASYFVFDNTTGEVRDPAVVPVEAKTLVDTRVAWSTFGLHLHFAVRDPMLWTHPEPQSIWQGDSVEVYVAGFSTLTGKFDATSDVGAMQIVLTPFANGNPARAEIFYAGARQVSLPLSHWKIRGVSTGYEVELRLPWAFIGGTAIAAGKSIGFTMAVNQKWSTTADHAFSIWKQKAISPSPSCGGGAASAFCDDRVWCTPRLL